MMQLTDLQTIFGNYLFDGAGEIVGLIMFGIAMYLIMMVTKDTIIMVILLIPIMLIFSLLGMISVTISFIMMIVIVVVVALNASGALFGGS